MTKKICRACGSENNKKLIRGLCGKDYKWASRRNLLHLSDEKLVETVNTLRKYEFEIKKVEENKSIPSFDLTDQVNTYPTYNMKKDEKINKFIICTDFIMKHLKGKLVTEGNKIFTLCKEKFIEISRK